MIPAIVLKMLGAGRLKRIISIKIDLNFVCYVLGLFIYKVTNYITGSLRITKYRIEVYKQISRFSGQFMLNINMTAENASFISL